MVYVIDDDIEDYEMFCDALHLAFPQTKCLHAQDGLEALSTLEKISPLPEYIVLDLNMPKMGGKECLEKIKANPRLKHIPVTILTTNASAYQAETFKNLGATDCVIKPSSFIALVTTVTHIIHSHPTR